MDPEYERVAEALPAYEIGDELGRGGWGVVLAARHRQLRRDVAIKQLPPEFGSDQQVRARFVAEARLLASLDHPHIVPIYDFVERDGLCLLVLERLTGGTLLERFRRQPLSPETACALMLAACAGLHYAHHRGVLHRDVKPENLMFSAADVLKVTDFGIAKVLGGSSTVVTRVGSILGTPAYMAPEQAEAKELSPATDVYACGTMLYELLSGRLPFEEDANPLVTLRKHTQEDPLPLAAAAPQVPRALASAIDRALARAPLARYPTAEAFGVAIARAGTVTWGPGWLDRSGVVLNAPGPISATARAGAGDREADDGRSTIRVRSGAITRPPSAGGGAGTHPPSPPPAARPSPTAGSRVPDSVPGSSAPGEGTARTSVGPRLALAAAAIVVLAVAVILLLR